MKFRKVKANDRKALRAIGRRIRLTRKARGLTGVDLARIARLSQSQISRIESGNQSVRSTVLLRIAKALKVSALIFFMDEAITSTLLRRLAPRTIRGLELVDPHRRSARPSKTKKRRKA